VNRVEWIVEDARPNSGHLQICHPAPVSGVFSAAVDFMQEVSAGDVLGWLSDPHSGEVHEIRSEQNGFVITMASFARVTKGDGLAVVMETQANGVTCRRP
jgi:predicted deacylase